MLTLWLSSMLWVSTAGTAEALVPARLERGLELVYRGDLLEETARPGVRYARRYRVEYRFLVLDLLPHGAELAALTIIKPVEDASNPVPSHEIGSAVRLERLAFGADGQLQRLPIVPYAAPRVPVVDPLADGQPLPPLPLDRFATLDAGPFPELPQGSAQPGQSWTIREPHRPERVWKIVGAESLRGVRCFRLDGRQQTADWDQPHPQASEWPWQRLDYVWVSPSNGFASRLLRQIERRDPATGQMASRVTLQLELESRLQYRGTLFDDRLQELRALFQFIEALDRWLPQTGRIGTRPFDILLAKIADHQKNAPATPYREALKPILQKAELARRGETPTTLLSGEPVGSITPLTLGRPAPDLEILEPGNPVPFRLSHCQGKPVVLIYVRPTSGTVDAVLAFGQKLQNLHGQAVRVVAFVTEGDGTTGLRLKVQHRLGYAVLPGQAAAILHGVEQTPLIVVLDHRGVVRQSVLGWGQQTAEQIQQALEACLRPAARL